MSKANTLAIVILSGGLDSATALGIAIAEYGATNVEAISFDYGQKHRAELDCARDLAWHYSIDHQIISLNPASFVGGSLTSDEEVQDMRYDDLADGTMSPTYVPFRNGTLIAQAAAHADSRLRNQHADPDGQYPFEDVLLYCGMHAEDGAGFAYADCTPEFLGAMASAIWIGTYGRVRLNALFQFTTKAEIIKRGYELLVPYELTLSCYRGQNPPCGACSTCHARAEAWAEAELTDPLTMP